MNILTKIDREWREGEEVTAVDKEVDGYWKDLDRFNFNECCLIVKEMKLCGDLNCLR